MMMMHGSVTDNMSQQGAHNILQSCSEHAVAQCDWIVVGRIAFISCVTTLRTAPARRDIIISAKHTHTHARTHARSASARLQRRGASDQRVVDRAL